MPAIALAAALLLAQVGAPVVKASGYGALRLGAAGVWGPSDPSAPPAAALVGFPPASALAEGNVQLRLDPAAWLVLYADASLFAEWREPAAGRIVPAPPGRNLFVPAELYAEARPAEGTSLLAGRKRVVWGSGFAWNPSDVLNPPKDPTDPAYQRTGAWMARAERATARATLTALWAPRVFAEEAGLPRRWLFDAASGQTGQLAALRAYALWLDADWSLAWLWSDRYADAAADSHRLAFSASRVFLREVEVHGEAMLQRGRDALVVDPACAPGPGGDLAPVLACAAAGRAVASRPDLGSGAIYLEAVAGGRYTFPDDSLLSLEWLFHGTGLDTSQFRARRDLAAALPALAALAPALPPPARDQLPAPADILGTAPAGQPARFAFVPLRRHYLLAVAQKPRLADDFTLSATLILGLEDRSGIGSAALVWSAREWLSLGAWAWVPFGALDSEFRAAPFWFRAALEARAWY